MYKPLFTLLTEEEMKLPFYVKSVGGRENEEHVFRPEGYQDYHWLHCVKGEGKLLIANREFTISENMGIFFYPGVPHEYYPLTESWSTRWVTFDGYAVLPLIKLLGLNEWGIFNLPALAPVDRLLHDIFITVQSDSASRGFECSTLLYKFLIELKNCINTNDARLKPSKQKQLQPVIAFIEKNYFLPITIEQMSELLNITRQHFCRLFKQAYHIRSFEYLTMVRIQKAKEIILEPDNVHIKDVAQRIGYNDVSYFCAMFKEYEV